jgi:hypothetical protein
MHRVGKAAGLPMTPKRPRDPNQLAKSIIDIATGQKPAPPVFRRGVPL